MEDESEVTVTARTLRKLVDAARLGNQDYRRRIGVELELLRSYVCADNASSSSLLRGPLGSLEGLLSEFRWREDNTPNGWERRWQAALQQASDFLTKSV